MTRQLLFVFNLLHSCLLLFAHFIPEVEIIPNGIFGTTPNTNITGDNPFEQAFLIIALTDREILSSLSRFG